MKVKLLFLFGYWILDKNECLYFNWGAGTKKETQMAYQVSNEIRKQTTKCLYDFECLKNDNWETCSIESFYLNNGLAIKDKCQKSICSYYMLFGFSGNFCNCPIRREIYQSYKI
jgi:hypothetical protein